MNINYTTPRQFCEGISALNEVSGLNYTRRPKYRFDPNDTDWWLVPSTANPHYKYAKLVFSRDNIKKSILTAGLHIEKGLDKQVKAVYSSKKASNFIMDESWYWNRFITKLNDNFFFKILENLFTGFPSIKISIDGGYVSEPTKFDPYQEKKLGWDKYIFTWKNENIDNLLLSETKRNAYILKLHHIKCIEDLRYFLLKISNDPWLWLNLNITVPFTIHDKSTMTEIDLWNCCFKILNKLIKI
ncbi:MAG: hypothetical protein K9M56_03470 [Victivallales bacterium]|nr:hypothetical protein [Victivallales bacterium]